MTKSGYIIDIIIRSFFIFIVCYLVVRNLFLALFITAGINLVFEFTIGKKYWKQFKTAEKKEKRKPAVVLKQLWQRMFSRQRTKGFVWAGVVILLMSFVVKLNIYYICFACLVFTMAAITRFAPPIKSATMQSEQIDDKADSQAVSKQVESV